MARRALLSVVWLLAGFGGARADLSAVKAEPNLEKRAGKALELASKRLEGLRKSYEAGQWQDVLAGLEEIGDAVELAHASLKATGKNPRKSPKHFKRAEQATRAMLRRLENLRLSFAVEDRPPVEKTEARLHKVHEELLIGIMSKNP